MAKTVRVGGLLAAALCWCAAAGALEAKVWPDKLRVKPDEPVTITVAARGLSAGTAADVECRVTRGIADEAAHFEGKTDASGAAVFTFTPEKEMV